MLSYVSHYVSLHALWLRSFSECYCCCRWSTRLFHLADTPNVTQTLRLSCLSFDPDFWILLAGIFAGHFQCLNSTCKPRDLCIYLYHLYPFKTLATFFSHWSKNSFFFPWVKDPHSVGPLPAMQVGCPEPTGRCSLQCSIRHVSKLPKMPCWPSQYNRTALPVPKVSSCIKQIATYILICMIMYTLYHR